MGQTVKRYLVFVRCKTTDETMPVYEWALTAQEAVDIVRSGMSDDEEIVDVWCEVKAWN